MKVVVLLQVMGILTYNFADTVHTSNDSWLFKLIKKIPVQRKISSIWKQTDKCKCGIAPNGNEIERIVGGIVSKKNAWPWMGAITYIGDDNPPKLLCGVSVINNKYLLTAAHCGEYLQLKGIEKFSVYLGTNDILNDTDAILPDLDSVILHPKYDTETKEYDAALIKLKSPLKFSKRVSPICIAPQGKTSSLEGQMAIVSGWGTTSFGGIPSTMQMQTIVNIISNKLCKDKYLKSEEPIKIAPVMLCASGPGSDSCQGDSGSPATTQFINKRGSVYTQIGIVSFGSGCAETRFPGVYVRLTKVLSWIKLNTQDAIYCKMNA